MWREGEAPLKDHPKQLASLIKQDNTELNRTTVIAQTTPLVPHKQRCIAAISVFHSGCDVVV